METNNFEVLSTAPMSSNELRTLIEKSREIRFELEDIHYLKVIETVIEVQTLCEINPKTKRPQNKVAKKVLNTTSNLTKFALKEVSAEELLKFRKAKIASFVLKLNDKLYHTKIPANISFSECYFLGMHKCAAQGQECKRLSAATDENGGCEKVRNNCSRIERYPWITKGYETFCTKYNSLIVIECDHFEKCPPQPTFSSDEIYYKKISLAQFLWPDTESEKEIRKKLEKLN